MMRIDVLTMTAAVALLAAHSAQAASKAKFYETCQTSVTQARELVPPPPPDIAGTAAKVGAAADVAGKLGGAFGLGGLGGLGKVASTTQQVAKYSSMVGDATQYMSKMKQDYPDAATRISAYGDKMGADADKVAQAQALVDTAHDCYQKSFTDLQAGVASKEIKSKDAKDRQKEIQAGVGDMASIVADAKTTMNANMKSYNDAINGDTQGMGINLGTIVSAAGAAGVTPQSAMGLPTVPGVANTPEAQAQAYQAAAIAQQNGYSATNSRAQNYAALAKTQNTMALGNLNQLSNMRTISSGPLGAANVAGAVAGMAKNAGGSDQAAAVPDVPSAMMDSLAKVGADSGKYMGTFADLDAKAAKVAELKTAVSAKIE